MAFHLGLASQTSGQGAPHSSAEMLLPVLLLRPRSEPSRIGLLCKRMLHATPDTNGLGLQIVTSLRSKQLSTTEKMYVERMRKIEKSTGPRIMLII